MGRKSSSKYTTRKAIEDFVPYILYFDVWRLNILEGADFTRFSSHEEELILFYNNLTFQNPT